MNKYTILLTILVLTTVSLSCSLRGGNKKENKTEKGSTEWFKEQGVNTDHLFRFDECEASYNGKTFTIGDYKE